MRRLLITIMGLAAVAGVFSGCEREGDSALQVGPTAPERVADKSLDDYLATIWTASDVYEYDTVSGTIDIDTGGSFTGHPASYPNGFAVSVAVPAGAVPEEYAEDGAITITVKVPQYGTTFVSPDDACPVILEPDGVQFREPIDIWVVLPKGLTERRDEGYLFYNVERFVEDDIEVFDYRDTSVVHSVASPQETKAPPNFVGPRVEGGCRNLIRCDVLHFSRWYLDDGGCSTPECDS